MSRVFPFSERVNLSQPGSSSADLRGELVDDLRRQLGRWGATATTEAAAFSCGARRSIESFPAAGCSMECWSNGSAAFGRSGAATLGLLSAREACREAGVLVVIDRSQTFYPPAAAAWGVDLERLIVVRPRTRAMNYGRPFRPCVRRSWRRCGRISTGSIAASFAGCSWRPRRGEQLGVLVRPAAARGQPTWADVRLEVSLLSVVRSPLHSNHGARKADHGRAMQVRLVHCHGGRAAGSAMLEIDDIARTVEPMRPTYDAHPLSVVTELADSTSRSLPARA